jgi:hypothetical protein
MWASSAEYGAKSNVKTAGFSAKSTCGFKTGMQRAFECFKDLAENMNGYQWLTLTGGRGASNSVLDGCKIWRGGGLRVERGRDIHSARMRPPFIRDFSGVILGGIRGFFRKPAFQWLFFGGEEKFGRDGEAK